MGWRASSAVALASALALVLAPQGIAQEAPSLGAQVFDEWCAICHEPAEGGAPTVESMSKMNRRHVLRSLQTGIMQEHASELSSEELRAVVDFLSEEQGFRDAPVDRSSWSCSGDTPRLGTTRWARWGGDLGNGRHLAEDDHDFSVARIPTLRLAWAFGFPGAVRARSQPVVTETMVLLGSQDGTIYALDRASGCVWWSFSAKSEVRNSMTIGSGPNGAATLYVGDFEANVYAIDAQTGSLLWERNVADHKDATITGSITHHDGRLLVPMSSTEIISAFYKDYECCTFRGGVLALRAEDGEPLWRMYTTDEPTKRKHNSEGVQLWGPSGAPVWSAPTVDVERQLVYVGTGENYSTPANDMSDAIIAIRAKDGAVEWVTQTVEGDAWNGACGLSQVNCPEEDGPDFDFGAPPILTEVDGRDVLLAGQKSGMIYALRPDDGKILWERRLGMGGFNGGVHWGMAVAGTRLIVPITDTPGNRFTTGPPRPGLHALDITTGEELWSTIHPSTCTGKRECYFDGLSASITTTDDLVFAANLKGLLAIYVVETGERLWTFDTRREFETVNGVEASGGTIDSAGAVVAGSQFFVNSGYDKWGEIAGNVLLAFEIDSSKP